MLCPINENLRIIYMPILENRERNVENCYALFNGNYQDILNLAMFISHAFHLRIYTLNIS